MMPPNIARNERFSLAQTPIFFIALRTRAALAAGCARKSLGPETLKPPRPQTLYVSPRRRVHPPSSRRNPRSAASITGLKRRSPERRGAGGLRRFYVRPWTRKDRRPHGRRPFDVSSPALSRTGSEAPRLQAVLERHGEREAEDDGAAAHLVLRLAVVLAEGRGGRDLGRVLAQHLPHAPAREHVPLGDAAAVLDCGEGAVALRDAVHTLRLVDARRGLRAVAADELRGRVAAEVDARRDGDAGRLARGVAEGDALPLARAEVG